jgi:hypothetical protein
MRRYNEIWSQILEDDGTSIAGVFKDEQVQLEGGDISARVTEAEGIRNGRDMLARAGEVEQILDGRQTQAEKEDMPPSTKLLNFPNGAPTLGAYPGRSTRKFRTTLKEWRTRVLPYYWPNWTLVQRKLPRRSNFPVPSDFKALFRRRRIHIEQLRGSPNG